MVVHRNVSKPDYFIYISDCRMCLSLVKATSHGYHCRVAKVLNCPLLKRETEEWHRNLSTNVKKRQKINLYKEILSCSLTLCMLQIIFFEINIFEERDGSAECLRSSGLQVRAALEALCCVLEQDTRHDWDVKNQNKNIFRKLFQKHCVKLFGSRLGLTFC